MWLESALLLMPYMQRHRPGSHSPRAALSPPLSPRLESQRMQRIGGGFAELQPTAEEVVSGLEVMLSEARAACGEQAAAAGALASELSSERDHVSSLSNELQRTAAAAAAGLRARDDLQRTHIELRAEMDEMRAALHASAVEVASLRQRYEHLDATRGIEVHATAEQLSRERAERQAAGERHRAREEAMERSWREERLALERGHAAEVSALQQGWMEQREKLEAAISQEKARASALERSFSGEVRGRPLSARLPSAVLPSYYHLQDDRTSSYRLSLWPPCCLTRAGERDRGAVGGDGTRCGHSVVGCPGRGCGAGVGSPR